MGHRRWQLLPIVPVLVLTLFLVGCPKRPATTTAAAPAPGAPGAGMPSGGPGGGGAGGMAPGARPAPGEFTPAVALQDIHFDFDRYDIRPGDAKTLDENAKWLKGNPRALVLLEGHCDERGTNEYNLALGERRAKATMNYLVSQGVRANRITLISYGKERPLCMEHNEECWAKNRRAHFLLKAG